MVRIHVPTVARIGALLVIVGMFAPWVATPETTLSGVDIADGEQIWHRPDLYLVLLCAAAVLIVAKWVVRVSVVRWLTIGASLLSLCLCTAFLIQGQAMPIGDGYISLFDGSAGYHLGPGSAVSLVGCVLTMASAVLAV